MNQEDKLQTPQMGWPMMIVLLNCKTLLKFYKLKLSSENISQYTAVQLLRSLCNVRKCAVYVGMLKIKLNFTNQKNTKLLLFFFVFVSTEEIT